jgi:hypothetical protein
VHVAAADPHTDYLKESDVAAKGDLYGATADDTVGVLTVGANGTRLTADSAEVTGMKWETPKVVSTDVIWDAKGDLAGGTGADTAAKLTVGANDTRLTADSAEATGMKWETPKTVATDVIWDTKGDIAGATGADTATKLAAGANDTVLTADSGEATGLKWKDWTAGGIAVILQAPAASDQVDVVVPFACTITAVTLLADASGSIVVDIWKDTYANFPPTDADTITAAAVPTISTATKSQDSTLTGWTTSVTAGDVLRFNVDSVTTITRCLVHLDVTKT